MKDLDLIKNDDAVSVVVGAILILAVLVTFMSVVTASWVPIYERNAESDHGDELFDTFLDLRKQMENADEFPKISTVNLGTDGMSLMKNSNSVGSLELNESAGAMKLTSIIYYSSSSSNAGDTLNINNLNTSDDAPIQEFEFNFTLDTNADEFGELPDDFEVEIHSRTIDKLKIEIEEDDEYKLDIEIEYGDHPKEEWETTITLDGSHDGVSLSDDGNNTYLYLDLLNNDIELELDEPDDLTIDGTTYHEHSKANLSTLIQHYLKQPADGTYDLYYRKYDQVIEGTQTLLYDTTEGTLGGTEPQLDLLNIGGGVLTMESDYNFMVDQSYIYDSGAVILKQEDGAVFKVGAPIFVTTDSVSDDLIISFQTVVLTGEHVSGGNGLETIQTVLSSPEYVASGLTDNITIIKKTTPELYDLWDSYFSELKDVITNSTASWDDVSDSNTSQVGINIYNADPNILLTVQTKQITLT